MTAKKQNEKPLSRRQFVRTSAAATVGLLLTACGTNSPTEPVAQSQPPATTLPPTATTSPTDTPPPAISDASSEPATAIPTEAPTLEPTPQCDDHDETPSQTAGPFYTPDTPQRTSLLEEGLTGTTLVVSGRVLTPACEPIVDAILDFWHADDNGQYDNEGYRLRGHQFTDANGNYRLETIVPGLYPGRTRHIHVRVQGANTALLTTQMYFPNEPANQNDSIFIPELLMQVQDTAEGQVATFDFVLA